MGMLQETLVFSLPNSDYPTTQPKKRLKANFLLLSHLSPLPFLLLLLLPFHATIHLLISLYTLAKHLLSSPWYLLIVGFTKPLPFSALSKRYWQMMGLLESIFSSLFRTSHKQKSVHIPSLLILLFISRSFAYDLTRHDLYVIKASILTPKERS